MVSIPYSRVMSFAVAESEGPAFSTDTLYISTIGGKSHTLEFLSSEKTRHAYTIMTEQILQQETPG
jgi:hypothetical protein